MLEPPDGLSGGSRKQKLFIIFFLRINEHSQQTPSKTVFNPQILLASDSTLLAVPTQQYGYLKKYYSFYEWFTEEIYDEKF